MNGIKISGVKVSGTEVFKEEAIGLRTRSTRDNTDPVREACPAWIISDGLRPKWPFNFKISQLRRWWRFGIISEELLLMQCSSCERSFVIMKEYHNGNAFCPYCKSVAHAIVDQESYLTAMCKYLLSRDREDYVEEGRK